METCLQDFLVILKSSLQNYKKILKICFLATGSNQCIMINWVYIRFHARTERIQVNRFSISFIYRRTTHSQKLCKMFVYLSLYLRLLTNCYVNIKKPLESVKIQVINCWIKSINLACISAAIQSSSIVDQYTNIDKNVFRNDFFVWKYNNIMKNLHVIQYWGGWLKWLFWQHLYWCLSMIHRQLSMHRNHFRQIFKKFSKAFASEKNYHLYSNKLNANASELLENLDVSSLLIAKYEYWTNDKMEFGIRTPISKGLMKLSVRKIITFKEINVKFVQIVSIKDRHSNVFNELKLLNIKLNYTTHIQSSRFWECIPRNDSDS